ncbi:MAG: isoprenylcysteine carboxylmethyltransferase family protein [Burkholderiales bacterium]|nr:isoprenylcysteine carboxylmethyltransferase family protein [Burkholderiales bacterium]
MPFFQIQVVLIIALLAPWSGLPTVWADNKALAAYALLTIAALLFLWVLRHNPLDNFSGRPEPPPGNRLVTTGPYRFIRHPMYLALFLALAGITLLYGEWWRWLIMTILMALLHFKSRYEERLLCERYPEYRDYQAHTKRILPFIL